MRFSMPLRSLHLARYLFIGATLIILLNAALGAYQLYELSHATEQVILDHQEMQHFEESANKLPGLFQRQMQDWKDILLVGYEPIARAGYTRSFEQRYREVQNGLSGLRTRAVHLGVDPQEVDELLTLHATIYADYMRVLPKLQNGDMSIVSSADATVRVLERDFSKQLQVFLADLHDRVRTHLGQLNRNSLAESQSEYVFLQAWLLTLFPLIALLGFFWAYRQYQSQFVRNRKAAVTLHAIADAVIVTDVQGNVEYMNPLAEEMTGWSQIEADKRPLNEIFPLTKESGVVLHSDPLASLTSTGKHRLVKVTEQAILVARNGKKIDVEETLARVLDENEKVVGTVIVFRDVTERNRAQQQIEHLAYHDQLTNLPNRRLLQDHIEIALAGAARHSEHLAILFIDLDRFKIINDTLGHPVGDALLMAVAQRLLGCVRKQDTIARIGGDEFVVLLTELHGPADAALVAQKVLDSLSRSYRIENEDMHSTPSIGISLYPGDGKTPDDLMKFADTAMYQVKQQGRAGYRFYSEVLNVNTRERLSIENDLHQALALKQFELYYQPKVSMRDRKVIGAEALIRWNHPTLGLMMPGKFIQVAEESNLISDIGEWVAHQTCTQSRLWMEAGMSVPLSLNVSARQFLNGDLVRTLRDIVRETGADPKLIELELTESLLMHPQDVQPILLALEGMGFTLALDDFGTGYSSLAYLRRLAIHTIKIDRSFVIDLTSKADDAAVVRAIIALAHSLRMEVVAEGVETEGQAESLMDLGCNTAQGYLYHKPLPLAQMEALLRQHRP
jgi:diguanylate cyclase (GGDEF)-like protein/PAS domain S-box-containing protein